jgi:hemolysin activation/secretion protein
MTFPNRRQERWFLAISVAATLSPVYAQQSLDHPTVPELPKPDFLPAKPQIPFELPPVPSSKAAPPEKAVAGKVELKRVVFQGNTVISTSDLEALCTDYLGRAVSVAELELLRQNLTRYYIDHGYLNSGVLFAQPAVADGTLTLRVIEGTLSQVHFKGLERLDERYISDRLVMAGDGPLKVDVLRERFQLLLDDPLFSRMNARITPDATPGEAILDIDVGRARPYQLTAFANNTRAPSIGSESVGLRGWVRNLSGRGDVLEGSTQGSAYGDPGTSYSLTWGVPLNYHGTGLSLHYDYGKSGLVEEPMHVLDVQNTLETRQAGLSHTFIDSLRHRLSLGIDYVDRASKTTLMGMPFSFIANETTGTTKVRSWRFWQEYSYRTESQVMALRSSFAQADTNLMSAPTIPTDSRYPDAHYNYWIGQGQYARLFLEQGLQLGVRATGQFTKDRLLSLDGLSVGGMNSVRGYRENQFLRDNGFFINAELEYSLLKGAETGSLTLVPFLDYGCSWNTSEDKVNLSSAGLALRYRWKGLNMDLAWAKRIGYPSFINSQSGNLQDHGAHFQVSYDFFGK